MFLIPRLNNIFESFKYLKTQYLHLKKFLFLFYVMQSGWDEISKMKNCTTAYTVVHVIDYNNKLASLSNQADDWLCSELINLIGYSILLLTHVTYLLYHIMNQDEELIRSIYWTVFLILDLYFINMIFMVYTRIYQHNAALIGMLRNMIVTFDTSAMNIGHNVTSIEGTMNNDIEVLSDWIY